MIDELLVSVSKHGTASTDEIRNKAVNLLTEQHTVHLFSDLIFLTCVLSPKNYQTCAGSDIWEKIPRAQFGHLKNTSFLSFYEMLRGGF